MSERKLLSRDELLKPRTRVEWVPLPSWGADGGVYVRVMGGRERNAYMASLADAPATGGTDAGAFFMRENMGEKLIVLTACDDTGARLFTDVDLDAVLAMSAPDIDAIRDAAMKINGLSSEAMDETAKNSERTDSGGSS